jgi:hypothetical protein
MPKSSVFHERARFAALTRSRQPDDPEYLAAKRNLAFAKTEAFIKEVVARAPDFTPEQIDQLRVLLEPARRDLADICPKSGGGIADAGARGGGIMPQEKSARPGLLKVVGHHTTPTHALRVAGDSSGICCRAYGTGVPEAGE